MTRTLPIAALLLALSPLAARATVHEEVASDLDQARQEVRADMAHERARLESGNLSLEDSLNFGQDDRHDAAKRHPLPKGEITPQGDLLVDGRSVAIDAAQRRQLLAYRAQVIGLAKTGIDAGEQAAMVAIDLTNVSMFHLIVGGLTGSLERRVESTVRKQVQPMVLQICRQLPQLMQSQQELAASVPEFRPYATLEQDDVADCEQDMRNEFATR